MIRFSFGGTLVFVLSVEIGCPLMFCPVFWPFESFGLGTLGLTRRSFGFDVNGFLIAPVGALCVVAVVQSNSRAIKECTCFIPFFLEC